MNNNIMVCVTKQKTCQRLIDFGNKEKISEDDQLYIIHVAHQNYNFLGNTEEGQALEFLYDKAREVGANLTVEKSENVISTLVKIAEENQINKVIVGESGEDSGNESFLEKFQKKLGKKVELIVVPSVS